MVSWIQIWLHGLATILAGLEDEPELFPFGLTWQFVRYRRFRRVQFWHNERLRGEWDVRRCGEDEVELHLQVPERFWESLTSSVPFSY